MSRVCPLRDTVKTGTKKSPMHTGNTEEYISGTYDFWLADEDKKPLPLAF